MIRRAGEEWIQIDRPFAKTEEVDLAAVLTKVGSTVTVGGVVVVGEQLMLRHALLLTEALEPTTATTATPSSMRPRWE
ncbi:hypothetical protein [Nocardia sp. CA-135398]|uniref:hypothetical protein n=1 Tax=Nocardia sp. CA-135398 TaxID=3239977 RepID=UPI003D959137